MFTDKQIKEVKKTIPKGISYQHIADKADSKITVSDVKRFYAFKSVPLEKGLEIVKITKELVKQQREMIRIALEA